MPDANRLEYVHRWEISGSPQPFTIRGAYMWGFVFGADLTTLERLVDTHLNHDPSGRVSYAPFAPLVMFGYSALDHIQPSLPPFGALGGSSELELAVFIPVRRRGSLEPLLFTPYVFVNNPVAVAQGREIYGFPKEMAWMRQEGNWPDRFPVSAFGIDPPPQAERRWRSVVSVERVEQGERLERRWRSMSSAAGELRHELLRRVEVPGLAALPSFLGGFWPPNARGVFRKRFPDCSEPDRSCYLGVVESDIRVTQVDYGYILRDHYALRLPRRTHHPMARDLGLRDGARALLAYEMKFSFALDVGREMWREGGAAPAAEALLMQLYDTAMAVPRRIVDLGVAAAQSLLLRQPESEPAPLTRRPSLRREKIAILGGGVGAMTAAFALTRAPDWKKRYDVTVYQLGWRLGGKGASGRDLQRGSRIDEHGIHIWFGFYENAFRVMRECYRELEDLETDALEDPILWGFEPFDLVVVQHQDANGDWHPTPVRLPRRPGWPGDDPMRDVPSTPAAFVDDVLRFVLAYMFDERVQRRLAERDEALPLDGVDPANLLATAAARFHGNGEDAQRPPPQGYGGLGRGRDQLLERSLDWIRDTLLPLAKADETDLARLWTMLDLGVTAVRGILADGALLGGFAVLDDFDFADWLRRHGAAEETLSSAWVRTIYSQGFAFEEGDIHKPRAAAGTVLRDVGRMVFTYQHSFVFKMRSGMGDVIFAPLYRLLEQQGVKFKFFHRVRKLHLSADGRSVARISVARQAKTKAGFNPLVKVKDLWCWPNEPDYSQLVDGAEIQRFAQENDGRVNFESAWSAWGPFEKEISLRAGADFDRVILGIPPGALGDIGSELIAARPRWKEMIDKVKTVRTQAFQLWMNEGVEQTGWPLLEKSTGAAGDPPFHGPIVTAFVEPLDTWGDMTHTLRTENWPDAIRPRQIAYFCGPMPDSPDEPKPYTDAEFPERMRDQVRCSMIDFLRRDAGALWPKFLADGDFRWDVLVDTQQRQGVCRALDQFCVANIDPSERYVLSLPGSIKARLRSDRSQFDNLCLAGDWTFNGVNAGCVEAAAMSGLRAARAICDWPERIIGEDHVETESQDPHFGDFVEEVAPPRQAGRGKR